MRFVIKTKQILLLLLVMVHYTCDLHNITDIYQPEISINSPKADGICLGEVFVELHATDNYKLREIALYFDHQIVQTWNVSGEEATVTHTIDLTDYGKSKDYEIKARAWDKAGNWRTTTQENYGVFACTPSNLQAEILNDSQIRLSWTAPATVGLGIATGAIRAAGPTTTGFAWFRRTDVSSYTLLAGRCLTICMA